VAINDYRNAFVLALSMDQPGRLLKLFRSLSSDGPSQEGSITGNSKVDGTISTLSSEDLCKLLRHVRSWNASTRTSEIAQRVLYAILKLRHHGDLEGLSNSVGDPENSVGDPRRQPVIHDLVDGLIPYTERHLHRLDRLVQESYVIDLIIGEMDEGLMHMEIIDQDDIFV
jgi:U3 small nucleolar RNA-associated protein 13